MSAWGNIGNDLEVRRTLSYNAAAGAASNVHRPNTDTSNNDQFPVLGAPALGNRDSNISSGSILARQLQNQLRLSQSSSLQQQQQQQQQQSGQLSSGQPQLATTTTTTTSTTTTTAATPKSASEILNQQQQQQIPNSQFLLNAIKHTNGNASIFPPGLQGSMPSNLKPDDLGESTEINNEDSTTVQTTSESRTGSQITPTKPLNDMEKFGLNALLPLLKMENTDIATISTGIDLDMLGLDLSTENSKVKISKQFASPWLETSRSEVEPLFTIPSSFKINSDEIPSVETRINTFNDETLFFIFYSKPRDVLQELVARELNNRNWRYHKDLQVWLTKDSSVEPIPNGPGSEHGTYIFFDPTSWEYVTKEFVLYYQSII